MELLVVNIKAILDIKLGNPQVAHQDLTRVSNMITTETKVLQWVN